LAFVPQAGVIAARDNPRGSAREKTIHALKTVVEVRDNIRQDRIMDKSTIVARLREYEGELKAAGIEHLLLHASYARGTAIREASDVDVIADSHYAKRLSLIGRVHLENRLTDILGVKADLADRKMLRPEVLERAQSESILVF
jgi:uncharacterized protein